MLRVTSVSEAGGHVVNEDAFVARAHPSDPDCWLCLLADGQGGRAGGVEAAQLACRAAEEAALRLAPKILEKPAAWPTVLVQADLAVLADPAAGFTTLIGFCLREGVLAGASSGDSAVMAVSGQGGARDLTQRQHKNPPVGSGGATFVPFASVLARPWTVLAMSDGVWKYVGWDRLVRAVTGTRTEPLVETLQRAARLRNGQLPDDFTVVAFEDRD